MCVEFLDDSVENKTEVLVFSGTLGVRQRVQATCVHVDWLKHYVNSALWAKDLAVGGDGR